MTTLVPTQALCFVTKGQIDPISWTVMGISAKENDSAIGFFGTGLKYSIAIAMREGWKMIIRSHDGEGNITVYQFGKAPASFRGKDFERVECNGQMMPYTTELGKNWEPWMAIRELICNTWDEGGSFSLKEGGADEFSLSLYDSPTTEILVEGESAEEAYANFDLYFAHNHRVLCQCGDVSVLPNTENEGAVFYKNVRVCSIKNSMFSYNVASFMELTEDRTLFYPGYEGSRILKELLRHCHDKKILKALMTAKDCWEGNHLEPPVYSEWSITAKVLGTEMFHSSTTSLHGAVLRAIMHHNPELGISRREIDPTEALMIQRALTWLATAGLPVTAVIEVVENQDDTNVAFVLEKRIYLTKEAFAKGMQFLVSTLIEEQAHVDGHHDCTTSYEQHLIDLIIAQAAKRVGII